MKLEYKINDQQHSVIFCKKNSISNIVKYLNKIKSDKNVLFIYDKKIEKKIVEDVFDELKLTGSNLIKIECDGDKLNKNEKLLFKILDVLLVNNFTKRSIVISFGGGVIGDVSALASSLYLRGLNYVCIPTTMTAIVDSSIGGKTAINYKGITNSLGTYYHPKIVFILEHVINNLPEREYNAGIAEVIKCGIIGDQKIIKLLKVNKDKILSRNINYVFKMCYLTLKTKINFFLSDIYEKNKRLSLNFGHTFAHAIEMALEQKRKKDLIRHGEAVGLGMLCEVFYEKKKKDSVYNTIKDLLQSYNLPIVVNNKQIPIGKTILQNLIYQKIFLDKKKLNKYPRFISIKKYSYSVVKEIKDFNLLNDTISHIIKN